MIIKVILGQRKETYVGQYAPRSLATMDEHTFEKNKDCFLNILKEHQKNTYWFSVKIIDIEVDEDCIQKGLIMVSQLESEVV